MSEFCLGQGLATVGNDYLVVCRFGYRREERMLVEGDQIAGLVQVMMSTAN